MYSVAIRTLGTSGDKLVRELTSITKQTIQPDKVILYIAEGYERPSFQIGKEEYIWVKKGMVSQRALRYDEIDSEYILLLDDDVELAPDSVEKLLEVAEKESADVVGADTFCNQDMSFLGKIKALITGWVYPHNDANWAFKINRHSGFSYLNNVKDDYYPSQSCAGPASLWRKDALNNLHLEDETFLDSLGFAFGDDLLTFHKVYVSNYKLYIHYKSGILHLDGKSSSAGYHKSADKFYVRSKASFILWWRTCYEVRNYKFLTADIYTIKSIWMFLVNCAAAIAFRKISIPKLYIKGIIDGWKFVHSEGYKALPKLNSYKR